MKGKKYKNLSPTKKVFLQSLNLREDFIFSRKKIIDF